VLVPVQVQERVLALEQVPVLERVLGQE